MPKYQQVIKTMFKENEAVLAEFRKLHDKYLADQKKWQTDFNTQGEKIVEMMRTYEHQLCGKSERSGMGMYSSKLAEKYWTAVKKEFPMIDFVGVKIL